jgi:hypothetical protein
MTRHSHEIFDSKAPRRGFVQRLVAAVATPATAPTEGGNSSGFTAGSEAVVQGGNPRGNAGVVQAGNSTVAQPDPEGVVQPEDQPGEPPGVELHVVDGRLIACRAGEPPPLSIRQHTQVFLEWLREHEKVPGNEVPVAIMEHILYWDFLGDTGLPMKPWRAVSDVLAKLRGVEKYQADWRAPTGEGPTPVVFKVTKRRRQGAKVVRIAAAERKRA